MGTLSSELGPHVERLVEQPRIYADANMPNGVVGYMRGDARMGRAVRARARRSAPGAGHRALPPRAAARPHARDARPRLHRRPAVSAGRESGRHRVLGARRALAAHAAARKPIARSSARRAPRRCRSRAASSSGTARRVRAMIFLADADVVLPDRLLSPATVVVDGDRIIDVLREAPARSPGDLHFDLRQHTIVPGFVDVHVHGVEGTDSLDGAHAIARIASRLPRFGVTAFCPTSVACAPEALRTMLGAVRAARFARPAGAVPRAAGAPRKQFHQPAVSRRTAARVPAPARGAWARRATSTVRRFWTRLRPRGPTSGSSPSRPRSRARSRSSARSPRTGIACRSATPARRTSRRSRASTPARGTPRISSIA